MPECTVTALWQPKNGNSADEYEDAFAHQPPGRRVEETTCRLAVADGASESSFANIWAKQLARQYCQQPFQTVEELQAQMADLYVRWNAIVFRRPLAWFAEEKARLGAFATLLGLELSDNPDGPAGRGSWRGAAVGDSCLFQVRRGDLLLAWPVEEVEHFDNSPPLLSSLAARNRTVWGEVVFRQGTWRKGDLFILATDALSAWLLQSVRQDQPAWREIVKIASRPDAQAAFGEWVETRRSERTMKNDDVTCLVAVMR